MEAEGKAPLLFVSNVRDKVIAIQALCIVAALVGLVVDEVAFASNQGLGDIAVIGNSFGDAIGGVLDDATGGEPVLGTSASDWGDMLSGWGEVEMDPGPALHPGMDCYDQCPRHGQTCDDFCGKGNACCRKDYIGTWQNTNKACENYVIESTFHTDGTQHECVRTTLSYLQSDFGLGKTETNVADLSRMTTSDKRCLGLAESAGICETLQPVCTGTNILGVCRGVTLKDLCGWCES